MEEQKNMDSKPAGASTSDVTGTPAVAAREGNRRGGGDRSRGQRRGGGGSSRRPREVREFEQRTLDLSRVTRVTSGGKRMRFRAALIIGDKKGRVGFGVAKGLDVQAALQKAYTQAKKNVLTLSLVQGTFPHMVEAKFGSAVVRIMPAPDGTGLKCGGAVRDMLEIAGVSNAVSKIINGQNKMNVAKATLQALAGMRMPEGVMTDSERVTSERKHKRDQAAKKVMKKTGSRTVGRTEQPTE